MKATTKGVGTDVRLSDREADGLVKGSGREGPRGVNISVIRSGLKRAQRLNLP